MMWRKTACILAAVTILTGFSSCMLPDVSDTGEQCPPSGVDAELSYIMTESCTAESCDLSEVNIEGDFRTNFEQGVCPVEIPQCALDKIQYRYFCTKLACDDDQHVYNGVCEDNTVENCGAHDNDCSKVFVGWKSGACLDARCVASDCQDGYDLFNGRCAASTCPEGTHLYLDTCESNTLANCGHHGLNCEEENSGWTDGVCTTEGKCIAFSCSEAYELASNGKCVARIECEEGYHLYMGACEEDTVENCGRHEWDCSKTVEGWLEGTCDPAEGCIVSKCIEERCVDGKSCAKGEANPKACGIDGNSCKTCDDACSGGLCVESQCGPGQHVYNGTCEYDSDSHCGAHDNSCAQEGGFATCQNGVCIVNECSEGFHSYGTGCEEDSLENCGGHGVKCSVQNGTSACTNGACTLTSCAKGFHKHGDYCEEDTVNNCGSHGNACKIQNGSAICTNGSCAFAGCDNNYHTYNGGCELNDNNNCGSHGSVCAMTNGNASCNNGTCIKSCSGGYHEYNGGCEANSTQHCGSHGNNCEVAGWAGGSCSGSTCVATSCTKTYHLYNNTCEVNSNENCNGHGKYCGAIEHGMADCNNKTACIIQYCDTGYKNATYKCEKI